MNRRLIVQLALLAAPLAGALSSCSSTSFSFSKKSDQGLVNVDELLARIEKVQVESLVAKERANSAYSTLKQTVAPGFNGDAMAQYKLLVKSIDDSKKQTKTLADSIPAMKSSANVVFERWTRDLDGFGNARMRQRSQERLEETRAEYEVILRRGTSAQLALEAFNADLNDHALFLGHDFNAQSAAAIHDDVAALEPRLVELDGRLNGTIDASKQYIAARALRGEVERAEGAQDAEPKAAAKGQRRKARGQPASAADGGVDAGAAGGGAQ